MSGVSNPPGKFDPSTLIVHHEDPLQTLQDEK